MKNQGSLRIGCLCLGLCLIFVMLCPAVGNRRSSDAWDDSSRKRAAGGAARGQGRIGTCQQL